MFLMSNTLRHSFWGSSSLLSPPSRWHGLKCNHVFLEEGTNLHVLALPTEKGNMQCIQAIQWICSSKWPLWIFDISVGSLTLSLITSAPFKSWLWVNCYRCSTLTQGLPSFLDLQWFPISTSNWWIHYVMCDQSDKIEDSLNGWMKKCQVITSYWHFLLNWGGCRQMEARCRLYPPSALKYHACTWWLLGKVWWACLFPTDSSFYGWQVSLCCFYHHMFWTTEMNYPCGSAVYILLKLKRNISPPFYFCSTITVIIVFINKHAGALDVDWLISVFPPEMVLVYIQRVELQMSWPAEHC